jgi:hypothetical protein
MLMELSMINEWHGHVAPLGINGGNKWAVSRTELV